MKTYLLKYAPFAICALALNALAQDEERVPNEDAVSNAINSPESHQCRKLRNKKLDDCIRNVVSGLSAIDANSAEWLIRKDTLDVDQAPIDAKSDLQRAKTMAGCKKKGYSDGSAVIGMTQNELYVCGWGRPDKINSTITANRTWLQLVYYGTGYVYIINGIVSTIQTIQ